MAHRASKKRKVLDRMPKSPSSQPYLHTNRRSSICAMIMSYMLLIACIAGSLSAPATETAFGPGRPQPPRLPWVSTSEQQQHTSEAFRRPDADTARLATWTRLATMDPMAALFPGTSQDPDPDTGNCISQGQITHLFTVVR